MELFSSYKLNSNTTLSNRVVMAPMTRARADAETFCATSMMKTYYTQRSGAGLIISEGIVIHPIGRGYALTPGLYNDEQVDSWQPITQAVHEKGGTIFAQLWHCGRVSHPSVNGDHQPVSSTQQKGINKAFGYYEDGELGLIEAPEPRPLRVSEIQEIVQYYADAAQRAVDAGFDGIEVHGANGYLLEQFLQGKTNDRTDEYGGSIENRIRFGVQVMTAIAERIGAERTGLRLSPFLNVDHPVEDPELPETVLALLTGLKSLNLAYINFSERVGNIADVDYHFRKKVRDTWQNTIIAAGGLTKDSANALIESGLVDLAGFGRPFISNPDLVARMRGNIALSEADPNTFYGGAEKGYIDYPNLDEM